MMGAEERDHGDGATEGFQERHGEAGLKEGHEEHEEHEEQEEREEKHRLREGSWTDPRLKDICWALSGYLK